MPPNPIAHIIARGGLIHVQYRSMGAAPSLAGCLYTIYLLLIPAPSNDRICVQPRGLTSLPWLHHIWRLISLPRTGTLRARDDDPDLIVPILMVVSRHLGKSALSTPNIAADTVRSGNRQERQLSDTHDTDEVTSFNFLSIVD